MNADQIVEKLDSYKKEYGSIILSATWLKSHDIALYRRIKRVEGLTLRSVAAQLGCYEDWKAIRKNNYANGQLFQNPRYDENDCIEKWRQIVSEYGADSLSEAWLRSNEAKDETLKSLRLSSQAHKLTMAKLAEVFNLENERMKLQQTRRIMSTGKIPWDDKMFEEALTAIINTYGTFPPYEFLIAKGYSNIINQLHRRGYRIEDIREKYHLHDRRRLRCEHNITWDSYPETICSNFLYYHCIEVFKGSRYPEDYSVFSGKKYGMYDIEFVANVGQCNGQRIHVEIWGNGKGHPDDYNKIRHSKEEYHKNDRTFVGIEYKDCYNEDKMQEIFSPYIDHNMIRKVEGSKKNISTSKWSLFEEVLARARKVCEKTVDHQLPSHTWFCKKPPYQNRKTEDWERHIYNSGLSFSHDLSIVGMNTIRNELGLPEKHDNRKYIFDATSAHQTLKDFISEHSEPKKVYNALRKKNDLDTHDEEILQSSLKAMAARRWISNHCEYVTNGSII